MLVKRHLESESEPAPRREPRRSGSPARVPPSNFARKRRPCKTTYLDRILQLFGPFSRAVNDSEDLDDTSTHAIRHNKRASADHQFARPGHAPGPPCRGMPA